MRAGNVQIGQTATNMLAHQRKLDLMTDFEIQALNIGVITKEQCERTETETDWLDREVHKMYRLWLSGVRAGKDEVRGTHHEGQKDVCH